MRRLLAVLALASAGCASTHVAPRTGAEVAVDEKDEQGLWALAGETQSELDRSGHVYSDPELEGYLNEVARRLEPPGVFAAIPFHFRVVRDRTPNAFCLPNGAIYVNTGMLALVEDEAELAALLGHEMTHAVARHALRALRSAENSGAFLNVLSSLVGAGASSGGLIFMASVAGYGRDLEREADREGLARVVEAGYDPGAAVVLFERMREWVKAEKIKPGNAFYASHPRLEERIESMRGLAAARGATGGERGAERYGRHAAPVLLESARVDLAAGRYASARQQTSRYLALRPEDAQGHLALGEIARREGAPGAEDAALASYRKAVELDPKTAEAWRGLGFVLRRRGDGSGAREAFGRYLDLSPDAADRAHVRAMFEELPGGQP
jgi:predicted Zn-dependent protease